MKKLLKSLIIAALLMGLAIAAVPFFNPEVNDKNCFLFFCAAGPTEPRQTLGVDKNGQLKMVSPDQLK
jgi:hypothetical protein